MKIRVLRRPLWGVVFSLLLFAVGTSFASLSHAGPALFKHINRTFVKPGEVRLLTDEEYYPAVMTAVEGARQSIVMAMYLFKTTKSSRNKPKKIIAALAAARKRGVQVKIILEQSSYDDKLNQYNHYVARALRRQNIPVFFDSPKITTHAKVVVVDDQLCFLGSHNLTHSALARNHEASLLIHNRQLAGQIKNYLKTITVHPMK